MIKKNLTNNQKAFLELLDTLTIDEKIILSQRFIGHKTLNEVAKEFSITGAAIKQKEDIALDKIEKVFDYINLK
jgi:DNA-directed RNA polymerase sigma subunit (sigma70/sigma32)